MGEEDSLDFEKNLFVEQILTLFWNFMSTFLSDRAQEFRGKNVYMNPKGWNCTKKAQVF